MKSTLLAVVLLGALNGFALAGDLYIGGSIGRSSTTLGHGDLFAATDVDQTATGHGVRGGIRFTEYLSAEIAYNDFGSYRLETPSGRVDVNGKAWDFSALGSLPLGHGLSAMGKLGLTTIQAASGRAVDTKTGMVYGVGIKFDLDRSWAVRGMYESFDNFTDSDRRIDNVSIGIDYRF